MTRAELQKAAISAVATWNSEKANGFAGHTEDRKPQHISFRVYELGVALGGLCNRPDYRPAMTWHKPEGYWSINFQGIDGFVGVWNGGTVQEALTSVGDTLVPLVEAALREHVAGRTPVLADLA